MDIDAMARVHAIELLVTQLIAEHLRSVAEPRDQARHAREQLAVAVDKLPLEAMTLDDEARLRLRIQENVTGILDAALRRLVVVPIR